MGKKDAIQGPGEYVPDPTEGVVCPSDLPEPLIEVVDRDAACAPCPHCQHPTPRLRRKSRMLHDLGDPRSGRPRELEVRYAQYHCVPCDTYFSTDLSDLCAKRGFYTDRVVQLAIRLVAEDNLPYRSATWNLWRDHRVYVPFATIQNWVEAAGEKSGRASREIIPRPGPGELQRLHHRRRIVRRPLVRPVDRGQSHL
jgi:hypothetical protein